MQKKVKYEIYRILLWFFLFFSLELALVRATGVSVSIPGIVREHLEACSEQAAREAAEWEAEMARDLWGVVEHE